MVPGHWGRIPPPSAWGGGILYSYVSPPQR
nr:MAG TPA: hypothetical protein [Caudoviricetes sp.]